MQDEYLKMGQLVFTAKASKVLKEQDVFNALKQHAQCDWSDVCNDDWREDDKGVKNGDRLISLYQDLNKENFYIITEAGRSVTTIWLEEDFRLKTNRQPAKQKSVKI